MDDIRENSLNHWLSESEEDDPVYCGFPRCDGVLSKKGGFIILPLYLFAGIFVPFGDIFSLFFPLKAY